MRIPSGVESAPINALKPAPRNARTHSNKQIEQIAASIKEFGFTNPVLIDEKKSILAGHGRVEAAKLLEMSEVPVVRIEHMTTAQKRAYVIADNRLALNAGWDDGILALEFGELGDLGFDLELTGFEMGEIDGLLGSLDLEGSADEPIPAVSAGPVVTRLGDLWQMVCRQAPVLVSLLEMSLKRSGFPKRLVDCPDPITRL